MWAGIGEAVLLSSEQVTNITPGKDYSIFIAYSSYCNSMVLNNTARQQDPYYGTGGYMDPDPHGGCRFDS